MTREEVSKHIRESPNKNFLLILPTGHGKTFQSLHVLEKMENSRLPVLIVVPRLVLIESWKEELKKFGFDYYLDLITFTTYNSLHKHCNKNWGLVIYDECHHLSDRCKELLYSIESAFTCYLSATVKSDLEFWLQCHHPDLEVIKVNLRDAIEQEVLPDPKVILVPLSLDYIYPTEILVKESKNKKGWITCNYKDRWKYLRDYNCKIKCTPAQYHAEISADIEYWKKRAMNNKIFKNKWLKLCGDRLKWLSNQKNDLIFNLLFLLKNYRTLTFCNSIEQTEILGKYCINSKNKASIDNLNKFNNKKIKHITACSILDEGANLKDCKIGIFAVLNSTERIIVQRLGRLLRHKEPVIIIPYFKHTREEELVEKMLENYNPELVTIVNNIKDIKI